MQIDELLAELDERTIARKIGLAHDEARMRYPLRSNTIQNYDAFVQELGTYYNNHFAACFSNGGSLSALEAAGRAKELVEREYRKKGGNLMTAFQDCLEGTNGGLRAVLDMVCEALKAEAVEHYVESIFDGHVKPNDWESKVRLIREFIRRCCIDLSDRIDAAHPERYAASYKELINNYMYSLRKTSSIFRRL